MKQKSIYFICTISDIIWFSNNAATFTIEMTLFIFFWELKLH